MRKNKENRQKSAKERQLVYNQLSLVEKTAKIDKVLGKDVGAKKERARLLKKIEEAKQAPKQEIKKETAPAKNFKKKYVKKEPIQNSKRK